MDFLKLRLKNLKSNIFNIINLINFFLLQFFLQSQNFFPNSVNAMETDYLNFHDGGQFPEFSSNFDQVELINSPFRNVIFFSKLF